jgi:hypothetical protein
MTTIPRHEVLVSAALIGICLEREWIHCAITADLPRIKATLNEHGGIFVEREQAVKTALDLLAVRNLLPPRQDCEVVASLLGIAYDELVDAA